MENSSVCTFAIERRAADLGSSTRKCVADETRRCQCKNNQQSMKNNFFVLHNENSINHYIFAVLLVEPRQSMAVYTHACEE